MKLFDQHLHSKHSFDSTTEPADNVRRAVEIGLAGLTFTEHYDTHPTEWPTCVYDEAAINATIDDLRSEFGRRIFVGKGIEVDYQRDNMPAVIDFILSNPFDAVILSIHWSAGRPIHIRDNWQDADPSRVTRTYLQDVLAAVRHFRELHARHGRVFDILGHLDFAKRYSHRFAGTTHIDEHMNVIDDILRTCLDADIVPEINTSTLRSGLAEPMPALPTIARYAEFGGTMVSIGSDAHKADHVGAAFDVAIDLLRQAGIKQTAVFQNRQRRAEPIG